MSAAGSPRPRVASERRIFSLVLALVASPQGLTKRELLSTVYGYAERYRPGEVDEALERQFERDKDQLRELGIPIETLDSPLESGNNQLTRYRVPKRLMQMPADVRFTAQELALLRLAAIAWREGSLTAESRRSAMKLEAMGAGLDVRYLGIAPRLGMPEPSAPELQRAIDQRLVARFDYRLPEREAPLARRVAPLRLHRADGRWHLIAHDLERGEERVFLLSRISGPVSLEASQFDVELFERVDGVIAELLALARAQRAVVRVEPGSVAEARLVSRGASAVDDGLEFGTLDMHESAVELAGFGHDVSVIRPPGLRDAVVGLWERTREQHTGRDPMAAAEPQAPEQTSRARRRRAALAASDRVMLLLALVPYLTEHGDTPLAELASVFEVDAETLRGLIEFLGTAGIPGETSTYQDEDLFDIDWEALDRDDIVRLTRVVAVDDTPRFSASEQAALIAGLHSLIPLLSEADRAHAQTAAEKLGAAGSASSGSASISVTAEPEDERISTVASAIDAGVRVAFVYRDLGGRESARTVEPLELSQAGSGWYLRGYCIERRAERTFLFDAMRELRVLDEAAEHRPEAGKGSRIGPEETALTASVRVRSVALQRVAAFSPRVLGPGEGDWVRAVVDLAYPAAAVRLVQSAPGEVVVAAPDPARAAVREWADRALAPCDR